MLTYLQIDGVKLPTPSEYTAVYSDFDSDDSVRDETGYLHRNNIRSNHSAPKFKWINIKATDLAEILKAVYGKERLQVTYYDPLYYALNNALHTFEGYIQATRQPTLTLPAEKYEDTRWTFECSFIEY